MREGLAIFYISTGYFS